MLERLVTLSLNHLKENIIEAFEYLIHGINRTPVLSYQNLQGCVM